MVLRPSNAADTSSTLKWVSPLYPARILDPTWPACCEDSSKMYRLAGCRASVSFRRMLSCTGVLLVLSAAVAAAAAPPLADDVPLLVSPCGAVAGADEGAAELGAACWLAGDAGAAPGAAADDAAALLACGHATGASELRSSTGNALKHST